MKSHANLTLGFVVFLFSSCNALYTPAGRSKVEIREPTRVVVKELRNTGFSINGVAPGLSIDELKEHLVSDVLLDGEGEHYILSDPRGALLQISTSGTSKVINKVTTEHKGTLMKGDFSLISCLDPKAQIKNLPSVTVQSEGDDFLVTLPDSSQSARLTIDSMVRRIHLE